MVQRRWEEEAAKRVDPNPESGTNGARQTPVKWTPSSGMC